MIWRRRRVVLMAAAAAIVGAFGYLLFAKPSYTSTSRLYIEQAGTRIIGEASRDSEHSDNYLNTQCQFIDSTPIVALALAQEGMSSMKIMRDVTDPIEYVKQHLAVEPGKKDDIISVSMESTDPSESAKLVNAIVRSYVTYQSKARHSTSGEVLDILQKEKDRDEAELERRNADLATLREKYGATTVDNDRDNPVLQQEATLSAALSAGRLETLTAKAAYDEAKMLIGNDPAKLRMLNQPSGPADFAASSGQQAENLKTEIFRLQESLNDYQRNYLPGHPLIKQTQGRLDQLLMAYVRSTRERWLTAESRQDSLQLSFDEQHKLAMDQASRASAFNQVNHDVARIESDLDVLNGRIKEVSLNQDAGALNISVLETAHPAEKPSHPDKKVILLGALLAGLTFGSGLAVVQEKIPTGARRGERAWSDLGLPILGIMPAIEGAANASMRAMQAHLNPVGVVAETSRQIARGLSHQGFTDQSGRTLLVCSANPMDGRSTVAVNLAIGMAQSGLRVLLIDANCQAPHLHKIFDTENKQGLFDTLTGRIPLENAIVPTPMEGVDLMPCGTPPRDAAEHLNNEALVDILGELADAYDRVIVDSPAMNRGIEARILAASCAACILVMASKPRTGRQVEQAHRLLQSVGANVLGLVLNEPTFIDPFNQIGHDQSARRALPSAPRREMKPVASVGG
ncbi:MAG: polysaccharide biosynthesis tyrosine autokinase [Planctomycetota bacterium]|nr:polysaccharide biosynthesis tyrosine autokinase [Planctomycetota bacterium]